MLVVQLYAPRPSLLAFGSFYCHVGLPIYNYYKIAFTLLGAFNTIKVFVRLLNGTFLGNF